jgi:hypothetical protein
MPSAVSTPPLQLEPRRPDCSGSEAGREYSDANLVDEPPLFRRLVLIGWHILASLVLAATW